MRYNASSLLVAFCVVSLLLVGCSSVEFLPAEAGLTPAPPPTNAEILGFVEWRGWGAMVFGFIPLGNVSAKDAKKSLTEITKKLGADGIASVKIHVSKTPMPFSLLWWYRSVCASGVAYKLRGKKK